MLSTSHALLKTLENRWFGYLYFGKLQNIAEDAITSSIAVKQHRRRKTDRLMEIVAGRREAQVCYRKPGDGNLLRRCVKACRHQRIAYLVNCRPITCVVDNASFPFGKYGAGD